MVAETCHLEDNSYYVTLGAKQATDRSNTTNSFPKWKRQRARKR